MSFPSFPSTQSPVPPLLESCNAALKLFGPQMYTRYLEFYDHIGDTSSRDIYSTPENWQEAVHRAHAVGRGEFPTPPGYQRFMEWLEITGKLYARHEAVSNTLCSARLCGHPLHPTANRCSGYSACPSCLLLQIAGAMARAWNACSGLGAPTPGSLNLAGPKAVLRDRAQSVWRYEKRRWTEHVTLFENLKRYMEHWEAYPERRDPPNVQYDLDELQNARSATTALAFIRSFEGRFSKFCNNPFPDQRGTRASIPGPRGNGPLIHRRALPRNATFSRIAEMNVPVLPFTWWEILQKAQPHPDSFPANGVTGFTLDVAETSNRNEGALEVGSGSYQPGSHAGIPEVRRADTGFPNDSAPTDNLELRWQEEVSQPLDLDLDMPGETGNDIGPLDLDLDMPGDTGNDLGPLGPHSSSPGDLDGDGSGDGNFSDLIHWPEEENSRDQGQVGNIPQSNESDAATLGPRLYPDQELDFSRWLSVLGSANPPSGVYVNPEAENMS